MNKIRLSLLAVTAVSIAVTGIVFHQSFVLILPLFVSLFIMLLQTKANRFAYLLGSGNAILYAVAYFLLGLYGSALYALCISFPLQIITFIRWSKRAYGNSTVLHRLTNKQRLLWLTGGGVVWVLLFLLLSAFGSQYLILDNTITILGIIATVFGMLALIEFQFLQLASGIVSCVLYATMLKDDPAQITYLVYTVYSLVCYVLSLRYMHSLYQKQQEEQNYETGMG